MRSFRYFLIAALLLWAAAGTARQPRIDRFLSAPLYHGIVLTPDPADSTAWKSPSLTLQPGTHYAISVLVGKGQAFDVFFETPSGETTRHLQINDSPHPLAWRAVLPAPATSSRLILKKTKASATKPVFERIDIQSVPLRYYYYRTAVPIVHLIALLLSIAAFLCGCWLERSFLKNCLKKLLSFLKNHLQPPLFFLKNLKKQLIELPAEHRIDIGIGFAGLFIFVNIFCGTQNVVLFETFFLLAAWGALRTGDMRLRTILILFAALLFSATLPWWLRTGGDLPKIAPEKLILFFLLSAGMIHLLSPNSPNWEETKKEHPATHRLLFALFGVLAGLLIFFPGINDSDTTGWHHWGAFIAPSEMAGAGARLFRDVPAQYGLGPTLSILAFRPIGYGHGLYLLAGTLTWLQYLLVALIALKLKKGPLTTGNLIAILGLALLSVLFWTAFAPCLISVLACPSTAGMRFLPVLILVSWLLTRDREFNPTVRRWGFILWGLASLWSLESMFYATFVWFPYYLWMRCHERGNKPLRTAFLSAAAHLLLSLLILIGGFLAVYGLIYRTTPTFYGYFAYALNPPGPMPIDWRGAIWFFIAVMALGLSGLLLLSRTSGNTRNSVEFRRLFLLLLLAYGTLSYFIGRSHENNILNLISFQVLVLFAVGQLSVAWAPKIATILLASVVGWTAIFGWGVWETILQPHPPQRHIQERFPDEPAQAVRYIQEHFGESTTLCDIRMFLWNDPEKVPWNAINDLANFTFVPSEQRRRFLASTAEHLHRSGWLLINRKYIAGEDREGEFARELLADYDSVYQRDQELDFGTYYAIRFIPR